MLKLRKPTSAGVRHQVQLVNDEITKGMPEKSLLHKGYKKRQGRGYQGHITVRHRGGGAKKKMRVIDFKRKKLNIMGIVKAIEYDPMRGANLALIYYPDGEKRYILSPDGLKVGDQVLAGDQAEVRVGNALPLSKIPVSMPIHNLELRPGKGGQIVRGAGTAASIQSKDDKFALVQLPSKEHRLISLDCFATIGQVGNKEWKNRKIGKAGTNRLMGIRPTVRGTAQHPGSHPHGGGEGRSGVGLKYSKTPWGKIASPGK
ncbi:MAG TPA: 50S ribosomal protein L2, partial [Candidatus Woesebacteria bacterium]|nr:50S ribosomal protein L2 [Candidatus Woesebacteria bacterium]